MKEMTFTLQIKSEKAIEEFKKVSNFAEDNGFDLQSMTSWQCFESGLGALRSESISQALSGLGKPTSTTAEV